MKKSQQIIQVCVAAALAAGSTQAAASGFALIEQNASGLGNAYAGQAAAAENASTIFFNPAGMTQLPGKQVSGALHAIKPSVKFTDNGGSASPFAATLPLGNNGGDAGGWAFVPNGYFSWQLSPQLWAGIGFTVPFGLTTEYDPQFMGRFQAQRVELETFDFNPSIAYKINDAVSIGAGISYQHAKLSLDRSFSLVATSTPQAVTLDDDTWGWNVGVTFNAGPGTRLGVSYRSAMSYDLNGDIGITGVGAGTARAKVAFPDSVSVALSHDVNDKWRLLGDVSWTHWSRIQDVQLILTSAVGPSPAGAVADTLDFHFRDTYRVGLGANYRWTERFMLKLGIAYDKSPVKDAAHRTVFLPDSDRTWLAFGAKHQLTKAGALDFGYTHIFVKDGDTFRNKGAGVATPGLQGIVSGKYDNKVDIVSVQYTHSF